VRRTLSEIYVKNGNRIPTDGVVFMLQEHPVSTLVPVFRGNVIGVRGREIAGCEDAQVGFIARVGCQCVRRFDIETAGARCFLSSRAICSNEGRFDGTRSQLARMTFMSWSLTRLDGGSEGLMFSSVQPGGRYVIINGKRRTIRERIPTQHGMPDGIVIHERPR
jgi:hypothetical protein